MQITVELPNDLAQRSDPARDALEALAVAGYRSGKLTSHQASRLLGFSSRFQFDAFLKSRDIFDHASGTEDLDQDIETLKQLRQSSRGQS
jgi:predicted HTH domain antitoxin